jgi:drug/metabolite transporter (DMT)-like permease
MDDDGTGVILAAVAGLFFSISYLFGRIGTREVDPLTGAFVLLLSEAAVLWIILLLASRKPVKIPDMALMKYAFLAALCAVGITVGLLNAFKLAGVGIATTTMNLQAVVTPLLAYFLMKDRISRIHLIALLLAFAGVSVMTFAQNAEPLETTWALGMGFAAFAMLCGSSEAITEKTAMLKGFDSFVLPAFVVSTASILIALLVLPTTLIPMDLPLLSPFIAEGIFVALGYFTVVQAMSKARVSAVIPVFISIQPVLATFLAVIFLTEYLSMLTFAGIAIVCAALFILIKQQ